MPLPAIVCIYIMWHLIWRAVLLQRVTLAAGVKATQRFARLQPAFNL